MTIINAPKYKYFDGKKYQLAEFFGGTRKSAVFAKKLLKQLGCLVRIYNTKKFAYVYARFKKIK
jgi:hypothetical protein